MSNPNQDTRKLSMGERYADTKVSAPETPQAETAALDAKGHPLPNPKYIARPAPETRGISEIAHEITASVIWESEKLGLRLNQLSEAKIHKCINDCLQRDNWTHAFNAKLAKIRQEAR